MYRVVIVDDEPWALQGLASLIKRHSTQFEIIGLYENPAKALCELAQLKPDVLFTDIRMPELSGIELIRAFRELYPGVEAVIISAHRDFEVAKDAFELEVRQYLLKPFNKTEVSDILSRIAHRLDVRLKQETDSVTLKEAAVYPFCCVLALDEAAITPESRKGVVFTKFINEKTTKMYLVSLKNMNAESELSEVFNNAAVGLSTVYPDFSEINAMLEEALMSLRGHFRFSANEQVAGAQKYLFKAKDHRVDAKAIANLFYLSSGYLSNIFKRETGTTMVSFFHQTHMFHAAYLLTTSKMSLMSIAVEVGYSDYNYFARIFKRIFSMSPETYRNKL